MVKKPPKHVLFSSPLLKDALGKSPTVTGASSEKHVELTYDQASVLLKASRLKKEEIAKGCIHSKVFRLETELRLKPLVRWLSDISKKSKTDPTLQETATIKYPHKDYRRIKSLFATA